MATPEASTPSTPTLPAPRRRKLTPLFAQTIAVIAARGGITAAALREALPGTSNQTLNVHIRALREVGLVSARRFGLNQRFYTWIPSAMGGQEPELEPELEPEIKPPAAPAAFEEPAEQGLAQLLRTAWR